MMKIGIIREGKIPVDKRVALTPNQAKLLKEKFPETEIVVQTSPLRCFSDKEYAENGFLITDDMRDCDVLLGVKEVNIKDLLEGKTYFFFSHTIKKQAYNRDLLREILKKNIRMVDYETLTDTNKNRVIAFGRYAGLVGAYNGLRAYGLKYKLFDLKPVNLCFDKKESDAELQKVKLPPIKIALTGGGRVASGAVETLMQAGIRRVSPAELLENTFDEPVFAQLNSKDYNKRKDGAAFVSKDFYNSPELFEQDFEKYTDTVDLLIACAFWDNKAPKLFNIKDIQRNGFKLNVIADVTCDIDGSIPTTIRPTTIDSPFYDFSRENLCETAPFGNQNNITVMSIDNLPCELPRDASSDFGQIMLDTVLPALISHDENDLIKRAVIAENGHLTPNFAYLQDFVHEKV
jgi:alanine dehydrogenase